MLSPSVQVKNQKTMEELYVLFVLHVIAAFLTQILM